VADPAPAGLRVEDETHAAEVDLEFVARFAIDHPDRGSPAPAGAAQPGGEPLQRAGRDHDPLPAKEIPDLGHREVLLVEPDLDLLGMLFQQPPRLAVTIETVRPDLLHHLGQEQIGELVLATSPVQTGLHRRRHVPPDRLAVHPRQPLHGPEPMIPEPQPQHFTDLVHTHLPEGHRRSSIR